MSVVKDFLVKGNPFSLKKTLKLIGLPCYALTAKFGVDGTIKRDIGV